MIRDVRPRIARCVAYGADPAVVALTGGVADAVVVAVKAARGVWERGLRRDRHEEGGAHEGNYEQGLKHGVFLLWGMCTYDTV